MDSAESLIELFDRYACQHGYAAPGELQAWADACIAARAESLLETAAIGFAFDLILFENPIDVARISPGMARAWQRAFPEIPILSLSGRDLESIVTEAGDWKGRLFDVEAARRLNGGGWIGDLHLEAGQRAELVASTALDEKRLRITDHEGIAPGRIQRKALELLHSVRDVLGRYRGSPVLADHRTARSSAELGRRGRRHDAVDRFGAFAKTAACSALASEGRKDATPADTRPDDDVAGIDFVAEPIAELVAALLKHDVLRAEAGSPPPLPGGHQALSPLRNRASLFLEFIRTLEPLYPCPARTPRPRTESHVGDLDELLRLVDASTRLAILRGSAPLDQWIESMVDRDISAMPYEVLRCHLADLKQIRADALIDKAFSGRGFLVRWENAMTGGRAHLAEKLDDAIEFSDITLKHLGKSLPGKPAMQIERRKPPTPDGKDDGLSRSLPRAGSGNELS